MTRQPEGGCIVTVGDWAVTRPYLNYLAYHTSKGAIPVFTKALAVELAHLNPRVRVNCVEPGPVMLPAELSPQDRAEAIGATLVQREGSPEHVAMAVMSLVENDFITGVCLPVDGGRSIWALNR
jgi:pteridine reductase